MKNIMQKEIFILKFFIRGEMWPKEREFLYLSLASVGIVLAEKLAD
jgi:hypothetical protein